MRVIQAAPHYPPTYLGGVELYTKRLARWLSGRAVDTMVVAVERIDGPAGAVEAEVVDEDGVEVVRLRLDVGGHAAAGVGAHYHADEIEKWWTGALTRWRPQVVHLHSGYLYGGAVLRAAAQVGVPVVVTLHDYWFICPRVTLQHPDGRCCSGAESPGKCAWCLATERRRYRLPDAAFGHLGSRVLPRQLERWSRFVPGSLGRLRAQIAARQRELLAWLGTAAVVLSPSEFLRGEYGRSGFEAERIVVHRLGVAPRRRRTPRAIENRALRVGFLGQVAPHKGIHVLVEAVRGVLDLDVSVRIHGNLERDPVYTSRLRKAINGDRRVELAGPVSHAELDDLFELLDVLVVPSVWYENSPFSILEAQAAGVPVIASKLGGMAELVHHGQDGLLFEMGSAGDLARQLRRLVSERGLLERLAAGAPRVPSIDEEFSSLLRLYHQLRRDAPSRPPFGSRNHEDAPTP